ncbi:MAG: NADPH-dependent 7-cyano-7-deazaguanine reductase QueF [Burkholderiaceae bacterium]|nr:NADPH-dependent 7-cyano-7-deazaguanine reductase QueF [Burkholderiaceae bacterium]
MIDHSPLGRASAYPDHYDASLLFPIAREHNRTQLSAATARPASGADIWTAYEVSWLNSRGKPQVAAATFIVPQDSPNIIESKSFKLYLNSLNATRLPDTATVRTMLARDLSAAAKARVDVQLHTGADLDALSIAALDGSVLDDQDIAIDTYTPQAELLSADFSQPEISHTWVSRLLKSNCPVTGQPDWADVQISYTGVPIDPAQLLRYIVSFRDHADFHEHCVERIFDDILRVCRPGRLSVYARYTRRGGLDINPWRSTEATQTPPVNARTTRQ